MRLSRSSTPQSRILLVQVEFYTWSLARQWSYSWHLGIEEGLQSNGVEFLTLTTPWVSHAREICSGRQFDQVWVNDIAHFGDHNSGCGGESSLEWLSNLAPICIGFLVESMEYLSEEYKARPALLERKRAIEKRFGHFTHIAAVDELDVTNVTMKLGKPALWLPPPVPERSICRQISMPSSTFGLFCGTLYGERVRWLEHPDLRNLLCTQSSPENKSLYPLLYNRLPGHRFRRLFNWKCSSLVYPIYLAFLRHIRRRSFAMWLRGLQSGSVVVNLPHLVKSYPGRVVEGMAVGRPVVSWEIPDRPKNRALFEDGKEILLFPKNEPTLLARHIQRILREPEFGQRIADNARRKLIHFHTIEKRVQQILNWIENGETPRYF